MNNVENEWHARDTSKKIKAVIMASAKRGERIALLEMEIETSQDKMLNSDRFLKLVDKYTDIQKLTPELVREFIDKIVVHERSEPYKKKNYTQQVDVYFNFSG